MTNAPMSAPARPISPGRARHRKAACAALLASLWLGVPPAASGENRAATNLSLYTDDDATDVITSVTRISADPWEGGTLEASYLIDIITSASVDVISNATPAFDENRHALGAGVSQIFGDATANLTYGYSREPDYNGHGIGGAVELSLAERNATLGLSYALELSQIGRADDPNFSEALTSHGIELRGSQILTPWLLLDGGYSLSIQSGYLAKPYRYAQIGVLQLGGDAPTDGAVVPGELFRAASSAPEVHPDLRVRNAAFAGLKAHVVAETAVEARYRLYLDNWDVTGHTVELLAHLGFAKWCGARLRYRLYTQGKASFYQWIYDQPQRYMTRDRELSALSAHLLGLKLFVRAEDFLFFRAIQLTAKIDTFQYDYDDFPALPRRRGLVIESGLEVVF